MDSSQIMNNFCLKNVTVKNDNIKASAYGGGDKSLVSFDISKNLSKIISYKDDDFDKTGQFGQFGQNNNLGNVSNFNMWDISCIKK